MILLFTSQVVFASKARLNSLGQSYHLVDIQNIFFRPADIFYLDPQISIESGITAATSTTNSAEGILLYSLSENNKIALALGHLHPFATESRLHINSILGAGTYELQQNPIHIIYARETSDINYLIGAYYSNKKDKIANSGEMTSGVILGTEIGNFKIQADYLFANEVTNAVTQFQGGGYLRGNVVYTLQATTFYLDYEIGRARSVTGLIDNENHKFENVKLGLVDSRAKDGNDVFWGAEVISKNIACELTANSGCNKLKNETKLPVWLGFEYQAADFLILRGSIKQSILVNYEKNENLNAEKTYSASDTSVALGSGLVFKNLTIDGSLNASSTQTLDSSNLLTQVSLTFNY